MPTAIKCIVHDKRVIDVLRALKPYALDPPVVDPIDDHVNGIECGVRDIPLSVIAKRKIK